MIKSFFVFLIFITYLFSQDADEVALLKQNHLCKEASSAETVHSRPSVFLSLAYLYRKAYAHIPYALKYNFSPVSTNQFSHNNVAVQFIDFRYKPGFRISCGVCLPKKDWLINFDYTRYYSKEDDSAKGNDYTVFPNDRLVGIWNTVRINGDNPVNFVDFHAQERIHYSILNGLISKAFLWPSNFMLTPYFGIQGGWIKVSESILYKGFASAFFPFIKVNLLNRFRGLGIKGGMKATWLLPFKLGIFGNLGIAELWGRFHLNQQEFQIYDSSSNESLMIETRSQNRFNQIPAIQTAFQFMLGISWGIHMNQRTSFNIRALYEVNFWPDFIQLRKYVIQKNTLISSDENHINYYRDNLAFQGLTLKACLSF